MTPAVVLLSLVTASRLGELVLARRNTEALLRQGGAEAAAGHYPLIVALHAAWLGMLWALGSGQMLHPGWLGLFLLLQAARIWVLGTLGRRWTTRIILVPGETLVACGPYRYVSHPNYLVVIGEIAILPLCLGLPWVALLFSALNAGVLVLRLRAENAGLRRVRRDVVRV